MRGSPGCSSGTMVKLICLRAGGCSLLMARLWTGGAEAPPYANARGGAKARSPTHTELVPTHDADNHALYLHVVGVEQHGLHRRIGGLQANLAVVAVELLQRDVLAADERDDHLAVVG